MTGITVKNLNKSYGPKLALNDVHLEVGAGEVHVLLGLSGSGKSTLLRIIMGLIAADSGLVQIAGRTLGQISMRDWVLAIGYIPQESGLFPHLTALKNVTLVAETLSWSQKKIDDRIREMLDLTSVDPALLKAYPRELSGGQKQRIALMRAAFLDPQVMVLDEPMGALDPIIRSDLQADLHQAFERLKKTVLLVTHDLAEAAFLAKTATLLKDGVVIQSGALADILEKPANDYVSRFVRVQRPIHVRGWPGE